MRLKELREDRDYTQKEIADFLHVKQNTYSQYENRHREIPLDMIIKLADFYDVSIDYLLSQTNNPKRLK
ncbi:MAG: helix-turn-helix transcriptional regulator [Clostridia bacterium]|nr:helix-turn-helix transcriptional regulator [Clostridia bacterium]